jgi:acyl-CoA synthetase (AMP-forming)/AMP-acid ligase II
MSHSKTIIELLQAGHDGAAAISAPGRRSLDYAGLRQQVEKTVGALNDLGVGRNDPVAIVLPNGPEMASTFVSVAAGATTAPLNPAYTSTEFEFYLTDLRARLLLVQADIDTPAIGAAQKLGLEIAHLRFDPDDPAGVFELAGESPGRRSNQAGFATSDDVALVLHTSGTTSRPKIVPLTQQNICASAANTADSLALTPQDSCLNIMPLFHIHGLMAAVLSSLCAGASVTCTPGFNALRFFAWMKDVEPSWYTAVPTMHQAILARAARNQDIIDAGRLRLIRSSSASLPPQVMDAVERTFGVPVIEAYGMTEAAHQMASNPLPPRDRVPGSVGVAAGPEISIMDAAGTRLPAGSIGEIVIRGPNVTAGYQGNPEANAAAFTAGWFRTGDQGILDENGYLRLTDRLKEIINRGGEKISPREVDEIILDHPDVAQVVTFSVPHDKLGEDVAAAVVLTDGSTLTEKALQSFVAERLAAFKVPRIVLFVDEIPKGATGKLARIGLAEKLGLAGS